MNHDLLERFHTFLYQVPETVKGGRVQPQWLKDGHSFCYLESLPGQEGLYRVDPQSGERTCLLDQPTLMGILGSYYGEIPFQDIRFGAIRLAEDEAHILVPIGEEEFLIDPATGRMTAGQSSAQLAKPRQFPWLMGNPMEETLSPDGSLYLGVEQGNLYVRSTVDGETAPLTSDGDLTFPYDALGACWSLDGEWLAVHRYDTQKMPRIALIPYLQDQGIVRSIPWASAGQEIWRQEVYFIHVPGRSAQKIDLGQHPGDSYINLAAWAGDELLLAISDRRCKHLTLAACRPGEPPRTLLTESAETFHDYNQFSPLPIHVLRGQGFLWLSERDGWQRMYRYDLEGNLVNRVSEEDCEVRQILRVDEQEGWVYFAASPQDEPYEHHLYRARLDGSGSERLTAAPGVHEVQFSSSGQYFLDTFSNLEQPYTTTLHHADGRKRMDISEMDIGFLLSLGWQPPEVFWVHSLDGQAKLRGVLYKPASFDPQRKYPVVEYIYGGPHSSDSTTSFYGFSLLDALAQSGFIVFVVDGRGTSGRGKAFRDVCYGQLGSHEIPEHAHVLRQLAGSRPYMDLERVGIFGLSYGGYLTLRAILTAPDTYHVAVATCAPPGVKEMAWAYVERYMNLPEDNPQGYEDGDCLSLAGNLQGKLLLMHGTSDTNAAISHTMRMAEAFIQAEKPFDMICFPEQAHLFEGIAHKYWMDRIHDYFVEHLKP